MTSGRPLTPSPSPSFSLGERTSSRHNSAVSRALPFRSRSNTRAPPVWYLPLSSPTEMRLFSAYLLLLCCSFRLPVFFLLGSLSSFASGGGGNGTVIASIPRPVHSLVTEQVGGSDAHALLIDFPNQAHDYKYQFLTNGVRMLIDRQDGNGWQILIAEIR